MTEKNFDSFLKEGNISFFGCREKEIPAYVQEKDTGKVRAALRRGYGEAAGNIRTVCYEDLGEIRDDRGDIYFLDREAVKVLFVDFPGTAHYVCVRLVPRLSWIIALPGLMRRLLKGLVCIDSVKRFKNSNGSTSQWLVLKHQLTETLHTRLSLSEEVGVQGFLDFLNEQKSEYAVLRFFEKLPQLYREGGDIDLLVSDNDERLVKGFLKEHPGSIGVDVWTVSRTNFNDVTYYPPPLARKILSSVVTGPAGAQVPAPKEAFLALAYHVVYHKGPFAGVPSSLSDVAVNQNPENDYANVLKRMAKELAIEVDITMEGLDNYLKQEGWQPQSDTLAKLAPRNKWIWRRFFAKKATEEVGLGIFILKQKAVVSGIIEMILEKIQSQKNFRVLQTKFFNDKEVRIVADALRGGVWNSKAGPSEEYLPAVAVLVLDTEIARSSLLGTVEQDLKSGIRSLKRDIRKTFDTKEGSIVHATDNTHETWEYIPVCFSGETENIKSIVDELLEELKPSLFEKMFLYIVSMPKRFNYHLVRVKKKTKDSLIQFLMQ